MKQDKIIKSAFYGTGRYWHFDNGQFGEKREVKQQDCWQLQIINDKITGLYFWQNNDCGGQRLNSACYSIHNLTGSRLSAYNDLIN